MMSQVHNRYLYWLGRNSLLLMGLQIFINYIWVFGNIILTKYNVGFSGALFAVFLFGHISFGLDFIYLYYQ